MKKLVVFAFLGLILSSFRFQSGTDPIVNALKSADAEQVGRFFDDFVDMKLLDKDEVKNLGKTQAILTLKAFMAESGITGFEKLSERELGNTMYLVGKLVNKSKSNNITIMLKQKEGKYRIVTLRIS